RSRDLRVSAQRDHLKDYVDSHEALLSPARQLPHDVVQEIFLTCLPSHRNAVMSPSEAPLLLGPVCYGWRAIVLSTPILWSSLHIHLNFVLYSPQRISAVAEWLARAGACPLSLSVV
ncbi:hypothetical protein B0H13DRAFT_1478966, partial [Mycena leptocephala]